MMSKEKILKGVQQQISNCGYVIADYEISGEASKEAIADIRNQKNKLKEMVIELEKLLI